MIFFFFFAETCSLDLTVNVFALLRHSLAPGSLLVGPGGLKLWLLKGFKEGGGGQK